MRWRVIDECVRLRIFLRHLGGTVFYGFWYQYRYGYGNGYWSRLITGWGVHGVYFTVSLLLVAAHAGWLAGWLVIVLRMRGREDENGSGAWYMNYVHFLVFIVVQYLVVSYGFALLNLHHLSRTQQPLHYDQGGEAGGSCLQLRTLHSWLPSSPIMRCFCKVTSSRQLSRRRYTSASLAELGDIMLFPN